MSKVVVSWIGYEGERRTQVLTMDQAREQWAKLPQPYRETYTVRDAGPDEAA